MTKPEPLSITLTLESPVRMGVGIPEPEVITGAPVVLSALVSEDVAPLASATLAAAVLRESPDGEPDTEAVAVELRDDGNDGDFAAGNGVFTTAAPGRHVFVARATGTSKSGARFERSAGGGFLVSDRNATVEPPYRSDGIDDNGNGRFERLRFEAGARNPSGGHYALAVILRAANGRILAGRAAATVGAGVPRVGVEFTASEVRSLGVDRPYAIAELRLDQLASNGWWLRDGIVDAGTTGPLRLADFESDAQAACAGDCNGDGQVMIVELVMMVNVALEPGGFAVCHAGDVDADGEIAIDEIVLAVGYGLVGCPGEVLSTATVTATLQTMTVTPATPTAPPTATPVPDATATGTRTAALTSTRIPTPMSIQTPSRTLAPTATRTPTTKPNPTATGTPHAVELVAGSDAGLPHDRVTVPFFLQNGGERVTVLQPEVVFDDSSLDLSAEDCALDPRLFASHGTDSGFFVLPSPARLLVLVANLEAFATIGDGLVFLCEFAILPSASPGAKVLRLEEEAHSLRMDSTYR